MYGKELIIDLHECDTDLFTRDAIEHFFKELCELIDMVRCDLHFWDEENSPIELTEEHTIGVTAVQFIATSNITIHTLTKLRKVFINIFSCKDFDSNDALNFTSHWFHGYIKNQWEIIRE